MSPRTAQPLRELSNCLRETAAEGTTDTDLLHRFRDEQDEAAFAVLLHRYGPMVWGVCRRIVGENHSADDVFQATFLVLARKPRSVRRPETLAAWLHGVAYRLAVQTCRRNRRRRTAEAGYRAQAEVSPLDQLSARELLTILDEELNRLPESQRVPLILCCLEGTTQEEAAERLGCAPGSIKGRLERGRTRLRARLARRGLTLGTGIGVGLLLAPQSSVNAELLNGTLALLRNDFAVSASVAELMRVALPPIAITKRHLLFIAASLVLFAGLGIGMVTRAQPTKPVPPAQANVPAPAKDMYGDPLPPGATARLGTVQLRAVDSILAVTPDGKNLLSASREALVRRWDAATGKLREVIDPLPGDYDFANRWPETAALSRDGRLIAVREYEKREAYTAVFDVAARKQTARVKVDGSQGAFSPDGRYLAVVSGYMPKDAVLIDLSTGNKWTLLRQSKTWDIKSAFSPDGNRVFSSTSDHGTVCWDVATAKQVWSGKEGLYHWTLTPDGKGILARVPKEEGRWQLLDAATGKPMVSDLKLPSISSDDTPVFAPDGGTLIIPVKHDEYGHEAVVWDCRAGKEVCRLKQTEQRGTAANRLGPFAPDGRSLFAATATIKRWDVMTGRPLYPDGIKDGHYSEVQQVIFASDGKSLASRAWGWDIRLWDVASRAIRHNLPVEGLPADAALTPDGKRLAFVAGEKITVFDAGSGKQLRIIDLALRQKTGHWCELGNVTALADNRRAVAVAFSRGAGEPGEAGAILTVVDLIDGKELHSRPLQTENRLAVAPSGQWYADGAAIFDLESGKKRSLEVPAGKNSIYFKGITADERLLAGILVTDLAGGQSKSAVAIWEVATGGMVTRPIPEQCVYFALSPDGRMVATIDFDGLVFWDVLTGKKVNSYPSFDRLRGRGFGFASSIAFSPDGRTVATGHPDGTILLWDVPVLEPPTRPLSDAERDQLWAALLDLDAEKALRAMFQMTQDGNAGVQFVRRHLPPAAKPPAEQLAWIGKLDHREFSVREEASRQLRALDLRAEPALREALKNAQSAETKRRVEELLAGLVNRPLSGEPLRETRAVGALERIGTPEARQLLEKLADGVESARLTREAKEALSRARKD
jgi:RNA polymerase sigma factor (sigma-70 family)